MRDRDKMKDDVIARLSDQLVAITIDCRNLREANDDVDLS